MYFALRMTVLIVVTALGSMAATADEPGKGVGRQMVGAAALPNVPGHNLTAVTVELAPGIIVPSHMHGGFVFVYVLEGTVRSQLDDAAAVEYRAGQSWMEPPGTVHTLVSNPSETDKATILAVFVAKEGAKLTKWEKNTN